MVSFKILNCNLDGRKNQNTSKLFSKRKHGFRAKDVVTKEWILENIQSIFPHITVQSNTQITNIIDADFYEPKN